jgi:hypothetical protein
LDLLFVGGGGKPGASGEINSGASLKRKPKQVSAEQAGGKPENNKPEAKLQPGTGRKSQAQKQFTARGKTKISS